MLFSHSDWLGNIEQLNTLLLESRDQTENPDCGRLVTVPIILLPLEQPLRSPAENMDAVLAPSWCVLNCPF